MLLGAGREKCLQTTRGAALQPLLLSVYYNNVLTSRIGAITSPVPTGWDERGGVIVFTAEFFAITNSTIL
jgi:hypothetical protein